MNKKWYTIVEGFKSRAGLFAVLKLVNWQICGFVFWCYEQVNIYIKQSEPQLVLVKVKKDIQQLGTHLDMKMAVSDGIWEQLVDSQKLTWETSEPIRFEFYNLGVSQFWICKSASWSQIQTDTTIDKTKRVPSCWIFLLISTKSKIQRNGLFYPDTILILKGKPEFVLLLKVS